MDDCTLNLLMYTFIDFQKAHQIMEGTQIVGKWLAHYKN